LSNPDQQFWIYCNIDWGDKTKIELYALEAFFDTATNTTETRPPFLWARFRFFNPTVTRWTAYWTFGTQQSGNELEFRVVLDPSTQQIFADLIRQTDRSRWGR